MVSTAGRMARWGRDTGLSVRMFIVMFLLAALYLAFMAVVVTAGGGVLCILPSSAGQKSRP